MNTFICTACGTMDNLFATKQIGSGLQCHRCLYGEWHGLFPERGYDESLDKPHEVINPPVTHEPIDGLTPSF